MAGGIGSRFWPLSTPQKPKQFLDISNSGKTLLQNTFERLNGLVEIQNVFVVSNEEYEGLVKEQLKDIPEENVLLEPFMRNTAPCIAYAVNKIYAKDKNANIIVSPADHFIANPKGFVNVVKQGLKFTANNDSIVTIGITPSYPATGYGYIEGDSNNSTSIVPVKSFKEKPEINVAMEYLNHGSFYWNSGLFIWNVKTIINNLEKYLPKIQSGFSTIGYYTEKENSQMKDVYENCDNISIDYGLMEHAKDVYVIPSEFGWSDVGNWKSLYDLGDKDKNNNVANINVKLVEASDNLIKVGKNKKVLIQGVNNLLIVDTNDTLLICDLDQDQRIKEFSALLK